MEVEDHYDGLRVEVEGPGGLMFEGVLRMANGQKFQAMGGNPIMPIELN